MNGSAMRIRYGTHPDQYAELTVPGAASPLAVIIHGGYWRARVDAALGRSLVADLAGRGWATWNLEYRRVGDGGGWPATFADVLAGIDAVTGPAETYRIAVSRTVLIGHSAGGHLAAWAAGRRLRTRPAGVVTQAGVLDLAAAERLNLSSGAAVELMGGTSIERPDDFAAADPARMLPPTVPVRCVHARADNDVPFSQSADYVAAARAAGGDVRLIEAAGDHFTLIDPAHADWRLCRAAADELARRPQ